MRALTLWPEWAWAVAHLDKDVENRGWATGGLGGMQIAIHAGRNVGGKPGAQSYRQGVDMLRETAIAAGLDPSPLAEWLNRFHRELCESTSAILAVVTVGDPTRCSPSLWAVPGRWHWPLLNVKTLPTPVPCRGAQGLWVVPREVENAVREQLRLLGEGGGT